jgi:hypothetical protein
MCQHQSGNALVRDFCKAQEIARSAGRRERKAIGESTAAEKKDNGKKKGGATQQTGREGQGAQAWGTRSLGAIMMETICIYSSSAGAVLLVVCALLALARLRDFGLWTGCAAVIAFTIYGFGCLQTHLWRLNRPVARGATAKGAASEGLLTPGFGPNPELPTSAKDKLRISDSAVILALGNSLAWSSKFPHTVLAQGGEPMIVIDKQETGASVSAKFFDRDGKIICELVHNQLYPGNLFRKEQSPHSLTVYDMEAKKALQVEFINPRAFRILGDFYLRRGTRVVITQDEQLLGTMHLSGSVAGESAVSFGVP